MNADTFIIFMNVADVIRIHDMIIDRYGGRNGILDKGLLESAINHPWMLIEFGNDDDQELSNFAATYLFHIIKNHAFEDGNKRTGLLTALEFLARNGFTVEAEFDELEYLALCTADSRITKEEIAIFFSVVIKKIG